MGDELIILALTAASIGFLHTALGPDHYLPFIAMSKAGKWSKKKTLTVTALSGVGHVLGSVLLGIIGIAAGIALVNLEAVESVRGEIAAWLLISFGFIYFVWGVKNAVGNKKHEHWHSHADGAFHSHLHKHSDEHSHVHQKEKSLTPWVIFIIFVFGPCEALIPLLMFPASKVSLGGLILVVSIFGITTIFTMLSVVFVSLYGIDFLKFGKLEKYGSALAGIIIMMSGVAVQFIGL